MSPRALSRRRRWFMITLVALAAALGACRRPAAEPDVRPAPPGEVKPSPTPPRSPSRTNKELESTLSTAADLFNRGENDLACERVKQALTLSRQTAGAGDQALQRQLERYHTACEPF